MNKRKTRVTAGKKSIYRGVIDHVKLEIKSGAKYGTRLSPGESHSDFQRTKLAIGFIGDDGGEYWFRAPEVNIVPNIGIAETAWLSSGDHNSSPIPTVAQGDRIAVSAAVKATDTSHGTQLYFVSRLSDDSGGAPVGDDRIAKLEKRIEDHLSWHANQKH